MSSRLLQPLPASGPVSPASLVESDVGYRAAFAAAGIGMALVDLDGRWLRVNPALCRMLGYREDELLDRTFGDVTHPDDLESDLAHVRRLLAGATPSYELEKRYVRRDGDVVPARLTVAVVRDAEGRPRHFVALVQDISAQKRTEETLRATVETQQTIATAGLDLDRVLSLVVERARRITGADAAIIEMVDGEDLVYRAAAGSAMPFLGVRLQVSTSLSGLCVRTGTVLRCDDADDDPRVDAEAARRVGSRSMVVVPLPHLGRIVGVLKISSPDPHAFGERDVATLELLAGLIAASIANASEYEAKQALVVERTRALDALADAERALRAREARHRAAMAGMYDGFVVLEALPGPLGAPAADFAVVEMNDPAKAMLGMPGIDTEGETLRSLVPGAARGGVLAICRDVVTTGRRVDVEHRLRHARTVVEWVRIQAFPLEGETNAVALVVKDVTARKRVEAELRAEASRDALTGLLNRRGFEQAVEPLRAEAARDGRGDVLLYLDLDGFKPINDVFGHAVGDEALRTVAGILRHALRASDLVARFGGDEFVVYASVGVDASSESDGAVLRARVEQALAADNARAAAAGRPYAIRASIGAVALARGESLDALLARADDALYVEKRSRAGSGHASADDS